MCLIKLWTSVTLRISLSAGNYKNDNILELLFHQSRQQWGILYNMVTLTQYLAFAPDLWTDTYLSTFVHSYIVLEWECLFPCQCWHWLLNMPRCYWSRSLYERIWKIWNWTETLDTYLCYSIMMRTSWFQSCVFILRKYIFMYIEVITQVFFQIS